MKFLEKNLEQIIFESDKMALAKRGLGIYGKLLRQLKIGNYGISDLVEIRKPWYSEEDKKHYKGEIIVYELKQESISFSTLSQAIGYLKGIRTFLERKGIDNYFNYRIILIGAELDLYSSFCYLPDFFTFYNNYELDIDECSQFGIDLCKYNYDFDGIKFEFISDYNLRDKGF